MTKLEPITPEKAVELYLNDRETELTAATLQSHQSRLRQFKRWCARENIENLNELTGRRLHDYRHWRREDGDLSPASEKTQMDTVRVFVRWLEQIDGVAQDLHDKVRSPELTGDDNIREVMLEYERAREILDYLQRYEYASLPHVVIGLAYHSMLRTGGLRALDVADYLPSEQALQIVHRPESGTPLKNQSEGERFIALSSEVCRLLDDWIEERRPDVVDENGREALVATLQGRAHVSTIRAICYRYTRPCETTGECPHGRVIEECVATEHDQESKCPSSTSPHALRRGGITHALEEDYPVESLGARAAVSSEVLRRHYDSREARVRMEQRRQHVDKL